MAPIAKTYLDPADAEKGWQTIVENDFESGLQGWSGLLTTGDNYYPTVTPISANGRHSMKLDARGDIQNVSAIACKRLMAYEGIIRWTSIFGWGTTDRGGEEENALDKLRWALDFQVRGDRRWWEVQYLHYSEGIPGHYPRWRTANGNAAQFENIDAISESAAGDDTGWELGHNDTLKVDFHALEWEIDTRITDGKEKYLRLNIDGQEVDISGQSITGTQSPETEFRGGSNFLFYVENRATNASDPYMLIDYTRIDFKPR